MAKEEKKFKKTIQPTDKDGVAIGNPHVYQADTQEELDTLVEAAIANGTRKIHEQENELKRLRVEAMKKPAPTPDGAEPAEDDAVQFKSRELTTEEKFIVKNDPEKAFDIMFKAKFGVEPSAFTKQQNQVAKNAKMLKDQAETQNFLTMHSEDYLPSKENQSQMIDYIINHKMAWTAKNLDIAFTDLTANGLLTVKTVKEIVEEEPAARTEPATPPVPPRSVPPGSVRRQDATASAPVVTKPKGPTPAEIAMMTSEQLKKLWPELAQAR